MVLARWPVGPDGYREAVTPDHADAQYQVLPKDNAEAVVDIMRAAAGEHDDEGG